MMVSGIVITGLSIIPLSFAFLGSLGCTQGEPRPGQNCNGSDYVTGGLIVAGVFFGVGIPLTVIGSKREGLTTARIAPWVAPRSAGLGLRFEL
jgi:hypothetical protein